MKWKLGLVGAALLTIGGVAHAQSSVTIYGLMDLFVGRMGTLPGANSATRPVQVLNGGGLSTSYLGFRGREDLGDGAYAAFELSTFIRADTGALGRSDALGPPTNLGGDGFFSRTSWVGIGHARYGSLRFGNVTTLMFINSLSANAFGASTTFSPMNLVMFVGGPLSGGTAWNNQIVYDSPSLGGLSFSVAGALPEGQGKRNLGAAVFYRTGDLYAGLAWQDVKKTPLTFADGTSFSQTKSWLLSGTYDFKWAKVHANLGAIKDGGLLAAPADRDHRLWSLSVSIPVGAGQILAGYASRKTGDVVPPVPPTAPGGNFSRRVASVGYDYFFSKRTDVYAIAMNDHTVTTTLPAPPRNVSASATSFGIGLRHAF
ncbi:MAG TPA: porin [Ramlibacter sp.]|uniref:porin n=1 Tax=Ramlibacter sp. TaxID=1917967 RepID=UPI002C19FD24|nr:porin [Ramlibacter sp.]HVZ45732.1 porin [Ramlibacter sp.]